ncbi:MAG: hypothetical protein KatS3mg111_4242 [Pirellulaceae bacterium]|nr:MAG: hypothetical protein KatS3mg111_4242 [Pirellulaceae bacterium]
MNHPQTQFPSTDLAFEVRRDFPLLNTQMRGKPLVYLDNGATTQKPRPVIEVVHDYYQRLNANVHRGMYELSQQATDAYEGARKRIAAFIGAPNPAECIFTKGTTEAINLVAFSWGGANLRSGDEVVITSLEHHSNIVPWQMICERTGAKLVVVEADADGHLDVDRLAEQLTARTRLLAMQHVSNALGTIHPVAECVAVARERGIVTLIDGAQWVSHHPTDVQELGCDFYAFSGHKLFGPTGIGVLWGRSELLNAMPPFLGGGDMIESVTFEKTTYAGLPNKFEAGTPHIAGAIGLGAAVDYVESLGWQRIADYEHRLGEYAAARLQEVPGIRLFGMKPPRAAIFSFILEQPPIAIIDLARALDNEGIAIRTGHHCCMPLMQRLQVAGTCRASLAFYNTPEDVDRLVDALQRLVTQYRTASGSPHQQNNRDDAQSSSPALADQVRFAPPSAPSVQEAADRLAAEFLEFDDRESKTELLMELANEVPSMFDALKCLSTPVPGCMSEVYLIGRAVPDAPDRFEFAADSNAQIVRGLIGLLQQLFSGQRVEEILDFDTEGFFQRIGLDEFVSTQRRSGLSGMLQRIRALAAGNTETEEALSPPPSNAAR